MFEEGERGSCEEGACLGVELQLTITQDKQMMTSEILVEACHVAKMSGVSAFMG